jgi:hypothetical protein
MENESNAEFSAENRIMPQAAKTKDRSPKTSSATKYLFYNFPAGIFTECY